LEDLSLVWMALTGGNLNWWFSWKKSNQNATLLFFLWEGFFKFLQPKVGGIFKIKYRRARL